MNSKNSIILLLLFLCPFLYAAEDIKILSSGTNSLVVEYTPLIDDTSIVVINGREYRNLKLSLGSIASENSGAPSLPFRLINVGVPSEFGNTIQIISLQQKSIIGRPVPQPKAAKKNSLQELIYEESPLFTQESEKEIVAFDEFGIARDLQIQTIRVNPFHFIPAENKIILFTKIVFQINFNAGNMQFIEAARRLEGAVVNFETAKKWGLLKTELKKFQKNSVLSSGIWYRFLASEEGIYKINRSQLSLLGIDANTVDPRKIKIYGSGGKTLPENPDTETLTDLVETAIYIQGESDGKFDEGDYILFYGRGVDFWEYSAKDLEIKRNKNYFSNKNYYWITSSGETDGKRIPEIISLNLPGAVVKNTSAAFEFHELDKFNIGKSGREYWGEELNNQTRSATILTPLNGRDSSEPVYYKFKFANVSQSSYNLSIKENTTTTIYSKLVGGYGNDSYVWGRGYSGSAQFDGAIAEDRSSLKFEISSTSQDSRFLLDYFEISFTKILKAFNDNSLFFSKGASGLTEYRLENFSNSSILVFDITDHNYPGRVISPQISGGMLNFQVEESAEVIKKYIAVGAQGFKTVSGIEKIENSNTHGTSPGAEYLIITHKKFKDSAQRLMEYRANTAPNKMSAVVVYIDEIFNEFSNGSLDPSAIRNFLRYAYLNWEIKPFYVLLFGDGTYDYLDSEGFANNYIPTYQTLNSLSELSSYPFDDYYSRIMGDDPKPDIALGRINVNSTAQADNYVEKIIYYENNLEKGLWRNTITLVADDGLTSQGNDGSVHTLQAERLANNFVPQYFDKNKLFLSKYPTVITGLGRRKPVVNEEIIKAVNNGTLILNFTGHGNPDVWTHEVVFERSASIPQFQNDKYFFLTAATCDFGKYDDPSGISGTEELLLLKNHGAIGVFSAARLVYSESNARINEELYQNIFGGSVIRSMGEAFFLTKQKKTNDNDEKFHLFCDPAITLDIPRLPVNIDEVNNSNLETEVQIKALGEVNIKGTVNNPDGSANTTFNGEGIISVFDSERTRLLEDIRFSIIEQGGVIFRGRVSIAGGKFETNFRVPKDISYENKNGKIVAYIFNVDNDGVGFTDQIIVGGTDSTVVDDGKGPDISIHFDDLSTSAANLVNPNFNLLVKLADETGLNTTGAGVGHKLEGVLNDDYETPIDFSNNFIGDLDSGGKSGIIDYKFISMKEGDYKIAVKAWDVFNNGSAAEMFFTVVNSADIAIRDVYNYPNPFASNTTFTFQHNLNKPVDVKIKIYTVSGRLIMQIEESNLLDKFVKIDWSGKDKDGSEIANGTYLYKIIVKSADGEFTKSVLGKLAVFR